MSIVDLEDNNIIPCFTGEETAVKQNDQANIKKSSRPVNSLISVFYIMCIRTIHFTLGKY